MTYTRIDGKEIYYWDKQEKALNNTPRHMAIKEAIYPLASKLKPKELETEIDAFKSMNPDWFTDL